MNNIGIYYAYWSQDWDVDFLPYISKVAGLGFNQLEINAGTIVKISPRERALLVEEANDKGITLSYCIGLSQEYDVSSADTSIRKRGIALLKQLTRAIGEMGGGSLSGIIYAAWPMELQEDFLEKRPYFDRSIASLKEAIKEAEDHHVNFNVEVVNRFEQFLMNTCEEALEFVTRVESPNLKILLDTFHMNIEEESIYAAVTRAGDYLGHIHLGENNRTPPGCGRGHIQWDELGKAIREINYEGALVMEPFIKPGGQVGQAIKVFRDLNLGLEMDEEARKSCQFVRSFLESAGIN